jgi:hypothetical protein
MTNDDDGYNNKNEFDDNSGLLGEPQLIDL